MKFVVEPESVTMHCHGQQHGILCAYPREGVEGHRRWQPCGGRCLPHGFLGSGRGHGLLLEHRRRCDLGGDVIVDVVVVLEVK
jgi:hypothetical protein